jgi:hypothetical protein
MAVRFGVLGLLLAASCIVTVRDARAELRPALTRPDLMEVGDPTLITRETLRREMRRNAELGEYILTYGYPDYAEVQRIQVEEPLADYEVRLYYLDRERELAFARVNVAPTVVSYGIRRFEGPIPAETLGRLLTVRAVEEEMARARAETAAAPPPAEPVAAEAGPAAEPEAKAAPAEPEVEAAPAEPAPVEQ